MSISAAIRRGDHDDELESMIAAIHFRRKALAPQAADFRVGDTVRFGNTIRPQYMRGITATVVAIRQTKITVQIDSNIGRYRRGSNIVTPAAAMVLVERG